MTSRPAQPCATLPPFRFVLSTIAPRVVYEHMGVPVFPPVSLPVGGAVELWWHIEDGVVSLRHLGSTLQGARLGLIWALQDRAMKLIVAEVVATLKLPSMGA